MSDAHDRFAAEPKYHLACAEACRRAGDLPAACAAYDRVLRLGIDDVDVRASLGLCLYWAGRLAASLEHLDTVVAEEGDAAPAVMCAYAGALLRTGALRRAIEWLERFTGQRPDVVELWLLLAQAHCVLDEFDAASDAVRQAVRLDRDAPGVSLLAAAVYLRVGDAQAATQAAEHALSLTPNDVDALLVYGGTCERRGDRAAAAKAYQAALDLERSELAAELLARVTPVD